MLTPFEEIPYSFVSSTLTVHQKEFIQIRYFIKKVLDKWKRTRSELYDELVTQLRLSSYSIRKLAEKLPKELDSEDLVCPCCEEGFKLKPQAYWSFIESNDTITLLCSRKCSKELTHFREVKGMLERKFYYIKDESS